MRIPRLPLQELALRDGRLCGGGQSSYDQRAAEQHGAGERAPRAGAQAGEKEQRGREDDAAAQKVVPVGEERRRPARADDEEGELVDAVERAAKGTPEGAVVRVFLNEVDPASFRQVGSEQFQEAVPGALWVQVEPELGADAMAVQGGPTIGSIEQEWVSYVELQDLAGLERERVVTLGARFLDDARGESA